MSLAVVLVRLIVVGHAMVRLDPMAMAAPRWSQRQSAAGAAAEEARPQRVGPSD